MKNTLSMEELRNYFKEKATKKYNLAEPKSNQKYKTEIDELKQRFHWLSENYEFYAIFMKGYKVGYKEGFSHVNELEKDGYFGKEIQRKARRKKK